MRLRGTVPSRSFPTSCCKLSVRTAAGRSISWSTFTRHFDGPNTLGEMNMATARRIYLYGVSAAALGMLIGASVAMLHLLLSKAGLGPQGLPGSPLITDIDRQILAGAISVGFIGLALWLSHWFMVERMVRKPGEEGAAERASIVRAVFFGAAMSAALLVAAALAAQLIGNSLGNIVDKTPVPNYLTPIYSPLSYVDDAWSLSIIIVALGAWAYHALIRARDLRYGTFIGGAAAWVSRFYLYGAALVGLRTVLTSIAAIIGFFGSELFKDGQTSSFYVSNTTPYWVRPVLSALVSILIWGVVWLLHLLYSNKLRSGSGVVTQQNASERTSKVRLAFFMVVVVLGATTVIESFGMSLGYLLDKLFGDTISTSSLGYTLVIPPLAAIPAAVAWFLHRRRGISESAEKTTGPSGRRISSYIVALIAVYAFASGAVTALAAVFGQAFATPNLLYGSYSPPSEFWKTELALGLGMLIAGAAFWIWPWFSSQRRRRADGEIGSTSRSLYLYSISGSLILVGAVSLAVIAFLYLGLALGLTDTSLGSEVTTPLALLIPAVVLFLFHALVLRGDTKPRLSRPADMLVAPTWPGSPGYPGNAGPYQVAGPGAYPPAGPGAYPPAGPVYGAPQGYPPAGPAQYPTAGPGAYPPAGPVYGAPQGYPPAGPMYAPPGAYQPIAPEAPAEPAAPD